jgi:hypothetical protein
MSYSPTDEALRNELVKHLAGLYRQGEITSWHDCRIGPEKELDGQISSQLNDAAIILLLVSADYLAFGYCYDVKMKQALECHE